MYEGIPPDAAMPYNPLVLPKLIGESLPDPPNEDSPPMDRADGYIVGYSIPAPMLPDM